MVEYLTPARLQEAYHDVLNFGIEGLKGLDTKHVFQLKKYAEKLLSDCINLAVGLHECNPNYNYPMEFIGNETEYWLTKQQNYYFSKTVLDVIDQWGQDRIESNISKVEVEKRKGGAPLSDSQINTMIDDLMKKVHPKGWEKVFYNETDYDRFKTLLIKFFSGDEYEIPNEKIKIKNGSKGNIQCIIKPLHDKYSISAGHLKDDKKLFEILRSLNLLADDNDYQIYKRISSNKLD